MPAIFRSSPGRHTHGDRRCRGIGKTWLALRWAHQHLDRFSDGQLFVDLRGFSPDGEPLDPLAAVRGFLGALGVAPSRITGGLAEHTALYRSQVAGRRMLIVLDNAATADQVTPLLPGTPTCTVLVTSRKILTTLLHRHGARHVSLSVFDEDETCAMLAERLGGQRLAAEPGAVTELITLCGRYPLALATVAGRAHVRPGIPLAEFAAELRDSGLDALDDDDPTASLPAVMSWSVCALTAEQRAVFGLLGIAPGADIGLLAAASLAGLSRSRARNVLRELEDASLLHRRPGNRYAMHDLIRGCAVTTAHHDIAEAERTTALRRTVDFYTHTAYTADRLLDRHRAAIRLDPPTPGTHPHPLPDDPAAMAWFDTEHPNLLAAHQAAITHGWHSTVWQLAWTLDNFHRRRGYLHAWLTVCLAAVDAAAHLPDPTVRIRAHRLRGRAHAVLGSHEEANRHLHQALAAAEEADDSLRQAHAHQTLAWAWEQRGEDQRAVQHAIRARDLYRALGQPVWEAVALTMVAWNMAQLGEYDTARTHCQAALTLHRQHDNVEGRVRRAPCAAWATSTTTPATTSWPSTTTGRR